MLTKILALAAAMACLAACAGFSEIPPCVPLDGTDGDPCDPEVISWPIGVGAETAGLRTPPREVKDDFDPDRSGIYIPHIVVRATSMPDTARCVRDIPYRGPNFVEPDLYSELHGLFLQCYMDYRANAYIVGEGPARLTVSRLFSGYASAAAREVTEQHHNETLESWRVQFEKGLGDHSVIEEVLFLSPTRSTIGAWQVSDTWNIVRHEDNVVALHPAAYDYQAYGGEDLYQQYKSMLELPLPALISEVTEAYEDFVAETDGRVSSREGSPMLVTDASKLAAYYEEVYDENEQPIPPPSYKQP